MGLWESAMLALEKASFPGSIVLSQDRDLHQQVISPVA